MEELLIKHQIKSWNYNLIASDISLDFIEKNIDKINWDWAEISNNSNLTTEFIKKYPNKKWDWAFLIKIKILV